MLHIPYLASLVSSNIFTHHNLRSDANRLSQIFSASYLCALRRSLSLERDLKKHYIFFLIMLLTASNIMPHFIKLSEGDLGYENSGMLLQTDIFRGSFIPESLVGVGLNAPIQISFSVTPIMGTSNTTIKIFLPSDIVDLVDGDLEWKGDVGKDETVTLKFTMKVTVETDSYIRAYVTSYINGSIVARYYYQRIQKLEVSSMVQVGNQALLGASSQTTRDGQSVGETQGSVESPAPGYINVYGYWNYQNEVGGYSPMRYCTVKLFDSDLSNDHVLLGTTNTDANGYYSFTSINNYDGPGEGTLDIFVEVYAESTAATTKDDSNNLYFSYSSKLDDVADGNHNFGTLVPTSLNDAWQAVDAVITECQWINTRVSWTRSQILIKWPVGTWPQHVYQYVISTGAITADWIELPNKATASWDHVVVHHEYGHAVMVAAYGWNRNNMPPTAHGGESHYVFSEKDGGFAIIEGWAEFMQCAVDNDPSNLADWSGGHGGNIETNDWYNCIDTGDMDGEIIEGSTASILWDILDPANDDGLSMGFDEIWVVFKNDRPGNIQVFWNAWFPRGYDYRQQMRAIYYTYGINKDMFEPPVRISTNTYTSIFPSVAASGSYVYVAWMDYAPVSGSGSAAEVWLRVSSNNGATFSSPIRISYNTYESQCPSVAASGTYVYVAWHDFTPVSGSGSEPEIWLRVSSNNGASFGSPIRISTNAYYSGYPSVSASGSYVYVAWMDSTPVSGSGSQPEIWIRVSSNNGGSFGSPIRISTNAYESSYPSVSASGTYVYVAWQDTTPVSGSGSAPEVWLRVSSNNGGSFGSAIRISTNTYASGLPSVSASGTYVYVAWQDTTPVSGSGGNYEIWMRLSSNSGTSFGSPIRISTNTYDSVNPSVAASGSYVYVAWQDKTPVSGSGSEYEIWLLVSSNNGASFGSAIRMSTNTYRSDNPSVVAFGSYVYVAWQDKTPVSGSGTLPEIWLRVGS